MQDMTFNENYVKVNVSFILALHKLEDTSDDIFATYVFVSV